MARRVPSRIKQSVAPDNLGWWKRRKSCRARQPVNSTASRPLLAKQPWLLSGANGLSRQSTLVVTRGKWFVSRGKHVDARGGHSHLASQPWLLRETNGSYREASILTREVPSPVSPINHGCHAKQAARLTRQRSRLARQAA